MHFLIGHTLQKNTITSEWLLRLRPCALTFHFPISSFPISHFPFSVPTFRVTRDYDGSRARFARYSMASTLQICFLRLYYPTCVLTNSYSSAIYSMWSTYNTHKLKLKRYQDQYYTVAYQLLLTTSLNSQWLDSWFKF